MRVRLVAGAILLGLVLTPTASGSLPRDFDPNDKTAPTLTTHFPRYQSSARFIVADATANEDCETAMQAWLRFPKRFVQDLPRGSNTKRRRWIGVGIDYLAANTTGEVRLALGDTNEPLILRRMFKSGKTIRVKVGIWATDENGNSSPEQIHWVKLGPKRK